MTQPEHLRCSDVERHSVERILADAYADGRLNREEYDERLDAVWKAKTFGELNPLTSDLLPARKPPHYAAQTRPEGGYPAPVSYGQVSSSQITTIMGSHTRAIDDLRLAPRTAVTCIMGETKLDLTRARLDAASYIVTVFVLMGEVSIWVPAGARIRDDTTAFMGETEIKRLLPSEDGPLITVRGAVIMGEVNITCPEHESWAKKKKRKWL